ncbi:MAG TPA: lipopolysaccharide heptosyltransferase I [Pseudomonadales bacterium]|nr:lipopolysaccharide heptosyltransferase I [Pseudomonadales bacterium]
MKVLIVKMSSLGDVVHTLPAVTDAAKYCPHVEFDWVVEEDFAAIPAMHPSVNKVLKVAIRRWRKHISSAGGEFGAFLRGLRNEKYDLIIDAQGLIKSAAITRIAKGSRVGLDWQSAREPLASLAYARKLNVQKGIHAIERVRRLFAGALGYSVPNTPADFGLRRTGQGERNEVIFLHGTTWASKHWPEELWTQLAGLLHERGLGVAIAHGNAEEQSRAKRIAAQVEGVRVLPSLNLEALVDEMAGSAGVITVDSGPGHLAAATGVPLVGLYGPTDPTLTGPYGQRHRVLASHHLPCIPCLQEECRYRGVIMPGTPLPPCFSPLTPERVRDALFELIEEPSV